jgi:hypothetical protein
MYYTSPQRPRVTIPTPLTKQVACLQDGYCIVDCRRHSASICPPIETPSPLTLNLYIPPATNLTPPHMTVNVHMDPSLVAGAKLNLNVREELRKAREEVECLKRQNNHLLEYKKG